MRINFFVENYLPGGLERFYFDLINGLPANEFEIVLFTNPLAGLAERLNHFIRRPYNWIPYHNITSTTVDYRLPKASHQTIARWLIFVSRLTIRTPLHFNSVRVLRHLFRCYPTDIIHIINGGHPGAQGCLTAAVAARSAGVHRILLSIQSYPYPRKSPLDKIIDRQIIQAVDDFIPNSLAAAKGLITLRDFPADKVHPIQTGTPMPPLDPQAGQRLRMNLSLPATSILIGTVATLEPMKGHLVLLDAFRQIQSEFSQAHLVFLGEGIARPQIESFIHTHHLEHRVKLLGHRDDAQALTNAFDLVAFPSFYEGLPIAILEAMALAKPIVATNVGGIPEEIDHNRSGILVPPRDSHALAGGLRQMLQSPDRATHMGRAAREKYYQQFTLQHMVNAYIQLYNRVR